MPLRSWLRRKPSEAEASSSSPSSSSSSSSKRRGGKESSRSSSRKQGSSSSRGKKSLAMVDADATTVTAEDAAGPALDKAAAPSSTSSVSTATTDASSSAATASSPSSSASSSRRRRSGSSSKKKAASEKQADEGAPGGGDADDGTTELNAEDLLAALYDSGELDEEEMDLVEQMEEPEEEADDGALNRPTSSTKKTKKTKKKSTTTTATRKAKKGKKGTAVSGGGKKAKRGGRKSGKASKVKPGKREDDDSSSSCSSSSSSASSASDSSSCDSASGSGSSSEDGSEEVAVLDDDVDDDDEDSSAADDVFIGGFDMEHADDDDSRDFACLSPIDIAREQSKEVSVVAETLSVNRDAATALLKHFQWKRERLLAEYFENPEKVRDEAGVSADASTVTLTAGDADGLDVAPAREDPSSSDAAEGGDGLSSPASAGAGGGASAAAAAGAGATTAAATPSVVSGAIELEGEGMCDICADDVPAEDCTALGCQHRFCNDCWGHYLSLKIREGHTTLPCMTSGCRLVCDEATVRRLVASDIFDKYLHFVTKSYVDDSGASVKWCPAPGCGNAITSDLISGGVVRCTCGHRFCFKCHREAHAPASCEQVHLWEKKCKDDSETDHWKYANAKECPKCDVATEKNGGCNHMSCRQCKHEWCWVCTRPWKGHSDYYNCNRYKRPDPSAASGGGGGAAASSSSSGGSRLGGLFGRKSKKDRRLEREAERERNRLALERYLHYFERFSTHSHSRDLEQQIRARAIGKIDELSAEVTTSSELQYIRDGTDALLESRNVLKYTYVFAYYLPTTGPERELFEYLQEHLEKTTESLSEVLEHPDSSQEYRLRAVNTIQLAKTRVNNLLSAVEQGLTDDSGEA